MSSQIPLDALPYPSIVKASAADIFASISEAGSSSCKETMVDYSKFNNIEGASDSDDDQKTTVDPDKAEAWLRKHDELCQGPIERQRQRQRMSRRSPASTGRRGRYAPRARQVRRHAAKTRRQAQEPDPWRR